MVKFTYHFTDSEYELCKPDSVSVKLMHYVALPQVSAMVVMTMTVMMVKAVCTYIVSRKKEIKCLFVISSTKLGVFR